MTKQEFLEQYGDTVVTFSGYYKYVFTFKSQDGLEIHAGGNSSDIYRCRIRPEMTVNEIEDETGEIICARKDDKLIDGSMSW